MEQLVSRMRRCIEDYNMIEAGDRIAVGLSGGKDSTAMLCALASLRGYYPKPFSLLAVTIELGFPDMDFRPLTRTVPPPAGALQARAHRYPRGGV